MIAPRAGHQPPRPGWKDNPSFADALPERDRRAQLEELRGWLTTWARGVPCHACGWPFPHAPYHVHDLRPPPREGPIRDD